MIKFSLVDVVNINCDVPRSTFSESSLDTLADLFLKVGGLVQPILLKQQGLRYSVLAGHFEYYIVIKAGEKNPIAGEMVQAFIIEPDTENSAVEQAKKLRESESPTPDLTLQQVLYKLSNLEVSVYQRFDEFISRYTKQYHEIEERIKEVEKQKIEKVDLLTKINSFSDFELAQFLENKIGFPKKLANTICSYRDKKDGKCFQSYSELRGIKGIGDKLFNRLLDNCI